MDLLRDTHLFMETGGQMALSQSGANTDQELRLRLLEEEVDEYKKALAEDDFIEELDGLCDIMVVAAGSLISRLGLPCAREVLNHILASNLSKFVWNEETEKHEAILREDGKILKGPNYFSPEAGMKAILKRHGFVAPELDR